MKKLVAESLQEFITPEEELNEQQVDEGLLDWFKGARTLVAAALKNPKDEESVNKALNAAFAQQFGNYPTVKEGVMKWPLENKIKLLELVSKKLQDKAVGVLTITKNKEGKLVVLGGKVAGGAGQETTGA